MLLYLTDGLFKELITVTIIVLIVEITRNLFNYLYNILFNKYSFKATSRIQVSIAKEAMKLEISELDNNSSGVFIDRINNDTKEIVSIFSDLGDGLIDVISNIGILIAIYFISKNIVNERTSTSIKRLNEQETSHEIARISSGEISEATLQYAKELRLKKLLQFTTSEEIAI